MTPLYDRLTPKLVCLSIALAVLLLIGQLHIAGRL